jgi:hypothetical protein
MEACFYGVSDHCTRLNPRQIHHQTDAGDKETMTPNRSNMTRQTCSAVFVLHVAFDSFGPPYEMARQVSQKRFKPVKYRVASKTTLSPSKRFAQTYNILFYKSTTDFTEDTDHFNMPAYIVVFEFAEPREKCSHSTNRYKCAIQRPYTRITPTKTVSMGQARYSMAWGSLARARHRTRYG